MALLSQYTNDFFNSAYSTSPKLILIHIGQRPPSLKGNHAMLASETDQGTENFSGLILYPSGPAGNTGGLPPSDFTFTYLYKESKGTYVWKVSQLPDFGIVRQLLSDDSRTRDHCDTR